MYLTIQLATFRGDSAASRELLGQAGRDETLQDGEFYDAACAAALCANSTTETDDGTSQQFKRLAIELLLALTSASGVSSPREQGAEPSGVGTEVAPAEQRLETP